MKSIVIRKQINEETDLLSFNVKEILSQVLDEDPKTMFSLLESKDVEITIQAIMKNKPADGEIFSRN